MKIVHFLYNRKAHWGIIEGNMVRFLRDVPFQKIQLAHKILSLEDIKFLPPTIPTKIILAGLNYKDHALELNMKIPSEPIIFIKPLTTLIAHGEKIVYPSGVTQLDYEAELAVIIKKQGKNISCKDAYKYILGYTCLNDVTARDLQHKDTQWTRAKSFDTFCPVGPWIETTVDINDIRIRLYHNNQLRQNSSTGNFIFSVSYLISFISTIMTLFPGDIISTGTPPGVGSMKRGDIVEVEIENIGKLKNYIQ